MYLKNEKTRYSSGQVLIEHRGVKVSTSVGHPTQDLLTKYNGRIYDFDIGYVTPEVANRPDLISYLFYNTPGYWWLLMLVNNVSDPFEGFSVGDRILIPRI